MAGVSDVLGSLSSLLAGRSVGKALLILGLVACLYQVWRKWRTRRLLSTKFRGKVVLVTGASSGLGEGACMIPEYSARTIASYFSSVDLARAFYAAGSKVILASRNVQQLKQLQFQLDNEPRREVRVQYSASFECEAGSCNTCKVYIERVWVSFDLHGDIHSHLANW